MSKSIWHYCFDTNILKSSTIIALVVGTILAIINHFNSIITLNLSLLEIGQIILTYLVPFSVATYSAAKHAQQLAEIEQ